MKTFIALLGKFVMTFVFAALALSYIAGNTIMSFFWVAILATIINYLVGDLLVLPSFGNIVASVGDGVMGALVAYIAGLATQFRAPLQQLVSTKIKVSNL